MKYIKRTISILSLVLLLGFVISAELSFLNMVKPLLARDSEYIERYRDFVLKEGMINEVQAYGESKKLDYIGLMTCLMFENNFELSDFSIDMLKSIRFKNYIFNKIDNTAYNNIYSFNEMIISNVKCFPIPKSSEDEINYLTFENTWGEARSYGGNRFHEGIDIMASNNLRGYFPIVSMTDGVVEKKGWLEKGGYRIGIRSQSGAYFYYAHLDSYSEDVNVGDTIRAGDLLGFMGDTGYSKVEGTVGQFPVHLHLGIYIDYNNEEISINPYHVLNMLR